MDIKHYLLLLCSIFILYLSGHVIFWIAKLKNPSELHLSFFLKLVTGIVTFFVVYSILTTTFRTVNLGFIIIAAASWYLLKKENLFDEHRKFVPRNINKSNLLLLFEILTIGTWWYIWTDHYYWHIPYNTPHRDIIFYSKIAEYLNLTHHENWFTTLNLFDSNYKGTSPYHYSEIWLTAGFSKIFNVLSLISYIKLTMPLLLTAISAGIIALFKNFFSRNYFNLLLPILVFLQGIYITDFLTQIDAFVYNPVSYPKYMTIYLMLIVTLLFFIKNKGVFFLPFLCIPIMSISCTAGIFGALTLFAVINLFIKNKMVDKERSYSILMLIISLFIFIIAFYSVTGIKEKNLQDTISISYLLHNLHTTINVVGATTLQVSYLYIIYIIAIILLFYLLKKKFSDNIKQWCLLLALAYSASLGAWAFLFQMRNSFQIFQNVMIPFLSVTIIFIFFNTASFLKENNRKFYMVPLFLLLINGGWVLVDSFNGNFIFGNYTSVNADKYVDSIKEIINEKPVTPLGVFFMDKSDYEKQWGSKVSVFYTLGDYLKLLKPYYNTISLTPFDTPLDSSSTRSYLFDKLIVEASIFYKFTANQKAHHHFTSIATSQIEFIKAYKIKYGIATKKAKLSVELAAMIDQQITDEKTGERFMLFKY